MTRRVRCILAVGASGVIPETWSHAVADARKLQEDTVLILPVIVGLVPHFVPLPVIVFGTVDPRPHAISVGILKADPHRAVIIGDSLPR